MESKRVASDAGISFICHYFKIPSQVLMELAGLVEPRTPRLREAVVRFAARSGSIAVLNQNEREALEAFVSALSEASPKTK